MNRARPASGTGVLPPPNPPPRRAPAVGSDASAKAVTPEPDETLEITIDVEL